jgi:hypothetical protein
MRDGMNGFRADVTKRRLYIPQHGQKRIPAASGIPLKNLI